jgi:hypothetical protein
VRKVSGLESTREIAADGDQQVESGEGRQARAGWWWFGRETRDQLPSNDQQTYPRARTTPRALLIPDSGSATNHASDDGRASLLELFSACSSLACFRPFKFQPSQEWTSCSSICRFADASRTHSLYIYFPDKVKYTVHVGVAQGAFAGTKSIAMRWDASWERAGAAAPGLPPGTFIVRAHQSV